MSESTDPDFDLEVHFLPSWAQKPADTNRYSNYTTDTDSGKPRGRRGDGPRPGGRGRREGGSAPNRKGPGVFQKRNQGGGGPRPGPKGRRAGGRDGQGFEPAPLPELNVSIIPDDLGVDSLSKQIRMTGRAYPLFEIARMVLQKPERHSYTTAVIKSEDGSPKQPLFVCAIDDSVWLSEDAAMRHVLDRHFELFYQAERTQVEPPKGTYTFVAQCGMSGVILGPPNYHDYQKNLHDLHARRFSKMPFETFKSRVKIVKDEEVVKKWLDEKSYITQYQCLNLPEPLQLKSREEVENHFRQTHLPNVIRQIETARIPGNGLKDVRTPALARLLRKTLEDQKRFPLQVATVLSQQFASRGLQFFKVDKTVTHVSVARPHFLNLEATPVSDNIKRIVQFIDQHPGTTRKELVDTLAPQPAPANPQTPTPPPAAAQDETQNNAAAAPPTPPSTPSPEAAAIITDLHWLVHQGHVIEFATGKLETAKKPTAKPPKPAAKASAQPNANTGKPPTTANPNASDNAVHATAGTAPSTAPTSTETKPSSNPAPSAAGTESEPDKPQATDPMPPVQIDQNSQHVPPPAPVAPNPPPQQPSNLPPPAASDNNVQVPPAPEDVSAAPDSQDSPAKSDPNQSAPPNTEPENPSEPDPKDAESKPGPPPGTA